MNFVCNECGYRFEAGEKKAKKCPYCSGKRVEKEKSAEELIDEVKVE